jgi:hypothetical protein
MPKKKVGNSLEGKKDDNQTKLEQLSKEANPDESGSSKNVFNNVDVEKRAEELSNRILRILYATYGTQDSHTNRHLYQGVMFEVARLSNKTIDEVQQKWPKFDIFSIPDKVKEVVVEELKTQPTIMYQMVMNSKIIADRILAKVIVKSMIW